MTAVLATGLLFTPACGQTRGPQRPRVNVDLPLQSPLDVDWSTITSPRTSETSRKIARQGYGVTGAEEQAIRQAILWLAQAQQSDGSWGPGRSASATAIALLVFLGEGFGPDDERYGRNVTRAVQFLVSLQNEDSYFRVGPRGVDAEAQGMVTYALAEACCTQPSPELKDVLTRSAQVILKHQQAGGGWYRDYQTFERYHSYARRDTIVSAWQIQALQSAWLAGVNVSGLEQAVRSALQNLLSVQDVVSGRFGAESRGVGPLGNTGAGVCMLQIFGLGQSAPVLSGLRALEEGFDPTGSAYKWSLSESYFLMRAVFNQGGPLWQAWKQRVAGELLSHQEADGHWTVPVQESRAGAAQATAFLALMLQTPYRYLPVEDWFASSPRPPRWRLEKGETNLFILGSYPLRRNGIYLLDESIYAAFEEAGKLIVPVDNSGPVFQEIQSQAFYSPGDRVQLHISKPTLDALNQALVRWKLPLSEVESMKPWALTFFALQRGQEALGREPQYGLESSFLNLARGRRAVRVLLKPQDIRELAQSLTEEDQEAFLQWLLREWKNLDGILSRGEEAWRAGDLEALESLLREIRDQHPEGAALDRLRVACNRRLAAGIEKEGAGGKPAFIIVDVWNLLGDQGVLEILKQKGYQNSPK